MMNEYMINIDLTSDNLGGRINSELEKLPSGAVIRFAPGDYRLFEPIEVRGKSDWTIEAEGCVFYTYYDPENGGNPRTKSIDAFHITGCKNLILRKITVRSAFPTNVVGTVTDVTNDYVDIRFKPDVPLSGREKFVSGMVYDEKRRATNGYIHNHWRIDPRFEEYKNERIVIAGEVTATNPPSQGIRSEIVGENLWRFYQCEPSPDIVPGASCCMSFSYYGIAAFVFKNCDDVLMEDIYMPNFGGMGVVVLARSSNFTFRRVVADSDNKALHYESLQSDGLHIVGLTGRLVMDECTFDCLSDDPLNVHTQILTVTAVQGNALTLKYDKVQGIIYEYWARQGDLIRVYDPVDYRFKGTLIVDSFGGNRVTLMSMGCDVREGDWLVNDAYFVQADIKNCLVRSCRGGFKLRSVRSAVLHDNTFLNTKNAIHVSLGVNTREGGPAENVTIERNTFTGAGASSIRQIYAGLYPVDDGRTKHLHKNIVVRNNLFRDSQSSFGQIVMCSTDKVTVTGNVFENCLNPSVCVNNCDDVVIRDNQVR